METNTQLQNGLNGYFDSVLNHINRETRSDLFRATVTAIGERLWGSRETRNLVQELEAAQRLAIAGRVDSAEVTEILSQALHIAREQSAELRNRDRWALVAFTIFLTFDGMPVDWDQGILHEYGVGDILAQNPHIPYNEMYMLIDTEDEEEEDEDED